MGFPCLCHICPNDQLICLPKHIISRSILTIDDNGIFNICFTEQTFPRYSPIIGRIWTIGWHICHLIQLNSPPMAYSSILSKNWFWYVSFILMAVDLWKNCPKINPRDSPVLGHIFLIVQHFCVLIKRN